MVETPPQTGPIAVYGATGYTGRLIAAALPGAAPSGARRAESAQLEILAEDLGGKLAFGRPAGRPPSGNCSTLRGGDRLRRASSFTASPCSRPPWDRDSVSRHDGRAAFMLKVFDDYGRAPSRQAWPCDGDGFDYCGDMLAALTAEGMGSPISCSPMPSAASARPGHRAFGPGNDGRGDKEWRDGELASAGRGAPDSWDFPDPIGRQRMVRYPAGQHVTVPRHVQTQRVRTLLTASTVIPLPLVPRSPRWSVPFQLTMRTPLRQAVAALIPACRKGRARRAAAAAASRSSARPVRARDGGGER
jgi:hypothetical protein